MATTPNPATQQNEVSSRGRKETSGSQVVLNTTLLSHFMALINTALFLAVIMLLVVRSVRMLIRLISSFEDKAATKVGYQTSILADRKVYI